MKKAKYALLEYPKGTTMYLLFADRQGHKLDLKEVEYQGFNESTRMEYWPEDSRSPATYQTLKTFKVSFVDKKDGRSITTTVDNIPYWTGQRAFDTDEHLTCGHAPYPYIDIYFTVSKEKLKKFLEDNKLLENFNSYRAKINDTWDNISYILYKDK